MFELLPFEHRNSALYNFFNHFDDDFFNTTDKDFAPCRTDIRDLGDKFVLEAELPGFQKDEVKINIENGCMTLTAQHSAQSEEKGKDGAYIRRERRMNSLSRSFDVSNIDEAAITAKFENGVLTLELPKKTPAKPLPKQVPIA